MAYKKPFHHYTFKDFWYRDQPRSRQKVRVVTPKQENECGFYLFEFVDQDGRKEFLDPSEIRPAETGMVEIWGD